MSGFQGPMLHVHHCEPHSTRSPQSVLQNLPRFKGRISTPVLNRHVHMVLSKELVAGVLLMPGPWKRLSTVLSSWAPRGLVSQSFWASACSFLMQGIRIHLPQLCQVLSASSSTPISQSVNGILCPRALPPWLFVLWGLHLFPLL